MKGGIQVFVRDLLDAGLLHGDTLTGKTIVGKPDKGVRPTNQDGEVIHSVQNLSNPLAASLRLLGGNLSPEFSAVLKLAGVEGGLENNVFTGFARVFNGEQSCFDFLDSTPEDYKQ